MSTMKWTPAARTFLFEAIVAKFGPYETWEKSSTPGNGKDAEYKKFCEQFADIVGSTADGVCHQIAWGTPTQSGGARDWTDSGRAYQAILCLAAALEAGFVRSKDLPKLVAEGTFSRTKKAV
jgi:hypothetical protein